MTASSATPSAAGTEPRLSMREADAAQRSREFFHGITVPIGMWTIVRVDGRSFSKLTEAHYAKPFDVHFAEAMHETARILVAEFDSPYGYTESDEISIVLPPQHGLFNRCVEKLVSLTAATASATFSVHTARAATFDSRLWVGAGIEDVLDYMAWRQADATRAALNTCAYWTLRNAGASPSKATSVLSHMTRADKHELLFGHGVNFNGLPGWAKRGVGLSWLSVPHIGVDPRTGSQMPTVRRRLSVHDDTAVGDPYREWLRPIVETGARPGGR